MSHQYAGETVMARGKNAGRVALNTVYSRGERTYKLIDLSLPCKASIITYNRDKIPENKRNQWTPEEVDAHYYTRKVFDYFLRKHGRKSYDNRCGNMEICVNARTAFYFQKELRPLKVPLWDMKRRQVRIPGRSSWPHGVTLGVIGHEWTHAVIQSSLENKGVKSQVMIPQLEKKGIYYEDFLNVMQSIADVFGGLIDPQWKPPKVNIFLNKLDKAAHLIRERLGNERLGKLYYHTMGEHLHRLVSPKRNRGERVDSYFNLRKILLRSLDDLCHENPSYWRHEYEEDKAIIQKSFAKVGFGK